MMKNVVITGADGFIGRHLVNVLLEDDCDIHAIVYPGCSDCLNTTSNNLHIYEIDLSKNIDVLSELPNNIDVMYNFAWIGVNAMARNDINIQLNNIQMAINCMKLAVICQAKKVIFPGSTNEYLYYGKPLNKDAVPSPSNAYGAVKIAVRYLADIIAQNKNIDFVYVIIAGIYAADRRDNNVIFYTIDKLLHSEKPSLTKLEQLWDYVYIDDVINALVAIGDKGKNQAVYAIGQGDNCQLREYIDIIHKKIDPNLPVGIGELEYSNDKMPCSCVDLTDLIKDTGFYPSVPFEQGIEMVINEMRKEMNSGD